MSRFNIQNLLKQMASEEAKARETTFLAPCVRGGTARTRIAGLVQTFTPRPRDFEGWGLFRPRDERNADVAETADLMLIEEYLRKLLPLRVRLVHRLQHRSWLAYPVNESDAKQKVGSARPLLVHLVEAARSFEQVIVRGDGRTWWFETLDRRADPAPAEALQESLMRVEASETLRFAGLTPEMRATYELSLQSDTAFNALVGERYNPNAPQVKELYDRLSVRRDEERLRGALQGAGGNLRSYEDKGEFWQVAWTTGDGKAHHSAISKQDLTVISSGICLSGEDQKFDLQSLVGVIEKREPGYWDDEEY